MDVQLVLGIIVAAVAVFGAVLSTLNFVAQRRSGRTAVKVTVSNSFFTYAVGPPISELMLQLSAANTGERPVVLSSFGFKLPDDRKLAILEPKGVEQFPHELLPANYTC